MERLLKVMIVEDDPMNARLLEHQTRFMRMLSFRPCTTVADALALLTTERPDVALIDIMLRNETSESIIDILEARKIPYVLMTACHPDLLPDRFTGVPTLLKPFHLEEMYDRICSVLETEAPHTQLAADDSHQTLCGDTP